jgi:hypothetical protein
MSPTNFNSAQPKFADWLALGISGPFAWGVC